MPTAAWLAHGQVQKLVLVVTGIESKETLERWVFNIETDRACLEPGCVQCNPCWRLPFHRGICAHGYFLSPFSLCSVVKQKSHKEIQGEIQAIIRQITASITFLPLLDEPCAFDLLVYTDEAAAVPRAWEESDPRYIANGSTEVRLRSFTTSIHKVREKVVGIVVDV